MVSAIDVPDSMIYFKNFSEKTNENIVAYPGNFCGLLEYFYQNILGKILEIDLRNFGGSLGFFGQETW